jgi:hypothetical protein
MVGGHCVDMPGYCAEIAPDIPADMRGYSMETAWPPVDIRRTLVRTLRDLPPYLLIRGWCLTKMTAFHFQKAARNYVRLNVSLFTH